MLDGMQYDPIQGQGQGHEPLKVGNPAIFKSYLRVAQNKIPHQTICNISATSGLILKILEAA